MATRYSVTQNAIGTNSALMAEFKAYYPDCRYVRCMVRFEHNAEPDPPSGVLVVRTRGAHQPGSGDYKCTHVYSALQMSGWYLSGTLYLVNCAPLYVWDGNYCHYYQVWGGGKWVATGSITYNFIKKTWNVARTIYHFTHFTTNGNAVFDVATYSYTGYSIERPDPAEWFALATLIGVSVDGFTYSRSASLSTAGYITGPAYEERYMQDQIKNMTVPNLSSYLNAAYIDAFSKLPQIQTNNIANLISLWKALKAVADLIFEKDARGLTEIGELSDLWLGYRYSFGTTKSDINEIVSYVDRMRVIRNLPHITSHGFYSVDVREGETYVIRCSLETNAADLLGIYSTVEQLGVALDGYNTWDLIPYSFIVDWFLRIGDLLEAARQRRYAMRLQPSAVWFSITHDFINGHGQHQCDYFRWKPLNLKFMSVLPASMLQHNDASTSTWLKRGADAVSIIS